MSGTRVCRVLPDVPAVDRVFDYLVPDELRARLRVGQIVRVPLHGRRVRGWVVDVDAEPEAPEERLRPLLAFVSAGPTAELVKLSEWAAWRWAGPRVAFLRAASPPNNVASDDPDLDAAVFPTAPPPIELPERERRLIRWPPASPRLDLVRSLLAPEGSTIVVAPDAHEATELGAAIESEGRHVLFARGDQSAAERTSAWTDARRGAAVVVGGRITLWAPVPDLRCIVVLDDVDEALEEERAPSWHALTLALERAHRCGARVDVVSPAPGAEAVVASESVVTIGRVAERDGWARAEVVDLRDEAPGTGLLSARLADALRYAVQGGGRAVCVLNRRGRARLLACATCRHVARCPTCDAALAQMTEALECVRCGAHHPPVCPNCGAASLRVVRAGVVGLRDHLAALVPKTKVVAVEGTSAPVPAFDIAIGTEAVLHRVPSDPERPVTLVAFLDFDQELLAPRVRAVEQALWLLVRATRLVGRRGIGGVVLVQTRVPDDPLIAAARDGDPDPVSTTDLARRRALGFPPFGGLAEFRGVEAAVESACATLAGDPRVRVVGPSRGAALLRADSMDALCDALAAADLAPARALGRLRVDVDPLRV